MYKTVPFFWVCLISYFSYSQTIIDTSDYKERKIFVEIFKKSNEDFLKDFKNKNASEIVKPFSKNYKEFEKDFIQEIEDKNFTFKSGLENYIQDIISELRINNPSIPKKIEVLIERSNYPNAFCLSNNTFVVNTGLFNWIENRDQLVAIISHELGHNILQHVLKSQIKNIYENLNEKNVVKTLREEKNNRTKKAFDVVKSKIYAQKTIKRNHEIEADSIGYVVCRNIIKNKYEYINSLKNLIEFDTISPTKIDQKVYKKLYDLPKQKFNESWLKSEDFSNYNYEGFKKKFDEDSISTHPETEERIAKLKQSFKELEKDQNAQKGDEAFLKMKEISKNEVLPNLYYSEKYGVGVYVAMQFLQDAFVDEETELDKQNFYKEWLGKCFEKIHEGRKTYKLNRYLDTIDPKNQSESYQQFLNFIWNLKLEEIKNIVDFYKV